MKFKQLIIAVLVLFVIAYSIDHLIQENKKTLTNQVYMQAEALLSSKALVMESIINRNINLLSGLEAYVTADYLNGASETSIQKFLQTLYGPESSALNLYIAPKGIISYIYPLKGNEMMVHWNLLEDPRAMIQRQIQRNFLTRQITVNGPFKLMHGNLGLIARKALYQNDSFWGFISVGIDMEDLLTRSGLGRKDSGGLPIAIRLPGQSAFYGDDSTFNEKHPLSTITLPDGTWEIAASPKKEKLQEIAAHIELIRTISLFGLLMIFGLFYYIIRQRDLLSLLVKARTHELILINGELTSANKDLQAGEEELRDQYALLATYNQALQVSEQRLSYLAYHDVLTGIANRAQFHKHLTELLHASQADLFMPSVIFFDLDNFKIVNDSHGHHTGDELLKQVTERIAAAQLPTHLFARFGGDEFAILLINQHNDLDMEQIAEQILREFKEPFIIYEQMFFVSPSIGIANYPEGGDTFDMLLKNSDIAMYLAKKEGGNSYKVFDASMTEDSLTKLEMGNHLRQALSRGELQILYQPQVDCRLGTIIGIEALLRWNHTTKGNIPAEAFIPLAEQMGLIIPIGEWVLRTACEEMKALRDNYGFPWRLSVNLSVKQLQDKGLVEKVRCILEESGLKAEYLELEITENMEMKDEQLITLLELRNLGVALSVDDFGTHYSSLSYLKRFPVTKIKLDQSFVRGLQSDDKDRSMIKAIIYVAQMFDLDIIAEGVETEQQVRFLVENGCHLIQGYYFYRPMEMNQIIQFIEGSGKLELRY